jgi:hypothetical protein
MQITRTDGQMEIKATGKILPAWIRHNDVLVLAEGDFRVLDVEHHKGGAALEVQDIYTGATLDMDLTPDAEVFVASF